MADYLAPTAGEMPDIVVEHVETPEPMTALGAKGIGEAGVIGAMGRSGSPSMTRSACWAPASRTSPLRPNASCWPSPRELSGSLTQLRYESRTHGLLVRALDPIQFNYSGF
jgi:hypothetical protein